MTLTVTVICLSLSISLTTAFGQESYYSQMEAYFNETHTWRYNLDNSAFIVCVGEVFPVNPPSFYVLFPPSEFSLPIIKDMGLDKYKDLQKKSVQTFCSKIDQYTACVNANMRSIDNIAELMLGFYLNKRFTDALETYCYSHNRDEVLKETDCLMEAVEKQTCYGGILDILNTIANKRENLLFGSSCSDIAEQVECRVEKQLSHCGQSTRITMSSILDQLLKKKCRDGETLYDDARTNSMRCFREFYVNTEEQSMQQIVLLKSRKPSMAEIGNMLSMVFFEFCRQADQILVCLDEHREPTLNAKDMDIFSKKVMSIGNLRRTINYGCNHKKVFAQNTECAFTNFESLLSNRSGCLYRVSDTMESIFDEIGNSSRLLDHIDRLSNQFCDALEQMGSCIQPSFEDCGGELGTMWSTLKEFIYRSCSDPAYVVPYPDKHNSAGTLLISFSFVLLVLMLSTFK